MSFVSTDPQNHQSENTWFTPKDFIEKLGPFDLDPCTMSFRPFDTAKKHIEHDKNACGLKIVWEGDVWLNPPYGKQIMPFIKKFCEHRQGVCLIFARTGSEAFQYLLKNGATFFFLRKRIKFINKSGKIESNSGTDSCIVFFDKKYRERFDGLEGLFND